MKVLVTGGSGLVGKALQKIHPEWIYVSSQDANLLNYDECYNLFFKYKPDAVIHLAALVGGLFLNIDKNTDMFIKNMRMELNVFECCQTFQIQHAIFCLSTCIFPDNVHYPLHENMLHNGPPHDSNYGYAYAKRMIEVMCRGKYHCIIPTNIYGPHDNFNLQNGHVIPVLIHKAYQACLNDDVFKIKGSGKALRQFIHADDVAFCISKILLLDQPQNIILAPNETFEYSIQDIVKIIAKEFNIKFIEYDTRFSDGQLRKTSSNQKLRQIFGYDLQFKSLEEGLKETIEWFKENYPNIRL